MNPATEEMAYTAVAHLLTQFPALTLWPQAVCDTLNALASECRRRRVPLDTGLASISDTHGCILFAGATLEYIANRLSGAMR